MRVGLISTYELGHQPLHLASPAALLRAAGHDVVALDVAVDPWRDDLVDEVDALGFAVPMHTAMRLALELAIRVRARRPDLPIALYGLYAPVSREATVGRVADVVLAGEYEPGLLGWVETLAGRDGQAAEAAARLSTRNGSVPGDISGDPVRQLGRQRFAVPARDLLPTLNRYASAHIDGDTHVAGYTEASRGCAHLCRHCPVPAVYGGATRVVDRDVVLADIDQQVAAGAQHLTFGDPDFLNAPKHALAVARALHARHPELTYDVTVKVEHVLRDEQIWQEFAATGCRFVISAVELLDDDILALLDKGHTAAQAAAAVGVLRRAGIEPRPSLLPFTPWSSVGTIARVFDFVVDHDLVGTVDPVQLSIRLLIPTGSLMLELDELTPLLEGYDDAALTWRWRAADPAVDALQERLAKIAADAADTGAPRRSTFVAMRAEVLAALGTADPARAAEQDVTEDLVDGPGLSEPWFCCAEPTDGQLDVVRTCEGARTGGG